MTKKFQVGDEVIDTDPRWKDFGPATITEIHAKHNLMYIKWVLDQPNFAIRELDSERMRKISKLERAMR